LNGKFSNKVGMSGTSNWAIGIEVHSLLLLLLLLLLP
jgi:hypothetical protein